MQGIISFIKTLSVISVILAALYMLVLKGKMEKSFKYVIGMFTVAAIISGASNLWNGGAVTANSKVVDSGSETSTVTESIDTVTAEYIIGELLRAEKIEFSEITLITDILEDGSINIIQAEVDLKNPKEFKRAEALVLKQTGIRLSEG